MRCKYLFLMLLSSVCLATQKISRTDQDKSVQGKLPIVLWHGMGDTCCGDQGISLIKRHLESQGFFVHSIRIGETEDDDRRRGFLDNINTQIDSVCKSLTLVEELKNGFNAMGFSQGGLFLRGYLQRCNLPKIHNLITFGSPHGGISVFPACYGSSSISCSVARSLVGSGVYLPFVQNRVVQAQYFRVPTHPEIFVKKCIFLPDVNQLLDINNMYAENVRALNAFVMVMFTNDTVVIPKESAWFAYFDKDMTLVPLHDQEVLWHQDLLGLRELKSKNKLHFVELPGSHMNFGLDVIDEYVKSYFEDDSIEDITGQNIIIGKVPHARYTTIIFNMTDLTN